MPAAVAWFGFVSGWLLFAGPIFQAAYELAESDLDRDGILDATAHLPEAKPPSAWWWLLPPVAYLKSRQRSNAQREALLRHLSGDQLHRAVVFQQVAHGWLIVATGAFFFALKETWELVHHYHGKDWVVVAVCAGMTAISLIHTSGRLARAHRLQELAERDD